VAGVKSTRRYDSSARQKQARQTRQTVLEVAQRQFLEIGYEATTIASIAAEAEVSVETIYKAFGGKPGLVRGIYDRALLGRDPVPAYQRSDEMRSQEPDPKVILRTWGKLTAEVAAEATPIRLLMRAAAARDPDIAALLENSNTERLKRMRHHARFLSKRGYLRSGVTVAEATDILWTCSSVELYELLVLQRGWSRARFARYLGNYMTAMLLPH
jgi:AcrR family transcriptional regulator